MVSTIKGFNTFQQIASVRLVADTNQSGSYYNGPLNNGVSGTFTYATGALTIDSVSVKLGNYILLAGQTNGYQNGIYECTQEGSTGISAILTRRGDFQCIEQVKGGYYVPVSAGLQYAGSIWVVIEPYPAAMGEPLVSGQNNINFFPVTASGSALFLQIDANLSDLSDPASAVTNLGFTQGANKYLYSSIATTDPSANLVSFDATVTAAQLSNGAVTMYAGGGTKRYKVRALWMNKGGTNFSGGGGDHNATISDDTESIIYSVIPAANLQAITNSGWGTTALPYPATGAINTSMAAGTDLVLTYQGGTTDYTTGSITISGLLERVA